MEGNESATSFESVFNDQPSSEASQAPEQSSAAELQQEDTGVEAAVPPTAEQAKPSTELPPAAYKALADERRKRQEAEQQLRAFQEQFQRQQQPRQPQAQPEAQKTLKPEQFETYEQYLEALTEVKAEEKAAKVFEARMRQMSEAQRAAEIQQRTAEDLGDMLTAGREKYADFDDVVSNPHVPISDIMMTTMMAIDGGHEVGYHLGKNPAEALRISRLPPSSQAREIGKLAKQLSTPAPAAQPAQLPKTLTQTRSTDGRFSNANAWTGPAPLNEILGKRS